MAVITLLFLPWLLYAGPESISEALGDRIKSPPLALVLGQTAITLTTGYTIGLHWAFPTIVGYTLLLALGIGLGGYSSTDLRWFFSDGSLLFFIPAIFRFVLLTSIPC
jgi:hypothetical protein